MVSRAQRETTKSNICIPVSPRLLDNPRRSDGVLYFRSKAVLGLPVSTTSYSRHAVSTIQSPISTADNDRSLIDTDGTKTSRNPVLLPYLHILIIPVRSQFSIHYISNSKLIYWNINISCISRVTGNYSTSNHPISREWLEITRLLPRTIKHSTSIVLYILV